MDSQDLLNDLKELKKYKHIVEPTIDKKKQERKRQFYQQNNLSLDGKKRNSSKDKPINKQGMFHKTAFCFPMLEPGKDPTPQMMVTLASGIYKQGGRIVQFRKDTYNQSVRYILVGHNSDIDLVRQALKGKVYYVSILNYKWVEECLKRFKKIDPAMYNLENGYIKIEGSGIKKEQHESELNNQQHQVKKSQEGEMIPEIKKEENTSIHNFEEADRRDGDSNDSSIQTLIMDEKKQEYAQVKLQQGQQQHNWDPQYAQLREAKQSMDYEDDDMYIKQENYQEDKNGESDSNCTEKIDSEDQNVPKLEQEEPQFQRYGPYYRKKINTQDEVKHEEELGQKKLQRSFYFCKEWQDKDKKKRPPWWWKRDRTPKAKLPLGSHNFAINNQIIDLLKKMQQVYANNGDMKQYAYLRTIASISNYGKQIKDAEQLKNIKGVGRETINKVKEFLKTGTIRNIEEKIRSLGSDPLKQLLRVHGIGRTTAIQLHHKGIRTIQNLKKHENLLNNQQKLGLKYVQQFQKRIPRDKVGRMFEYVKQALFYVARTDVKHDVEVVGSYRRGKKSCGDMDILITRKDGMVERAILQNLVLQLEKRKFITDHITFPKFFDGRSSVTYNGVCQFEDETHHRIDLKVYPVDQYAFALLYFTGSDLFNREMRLTAMEKGLMLSDHDIKIKQRYGRGRTWKGGKIPGCRTQMDIFDLLGMEYRAPHQRQI